MLAPLDDCTPLTTHDPHYTSHGSVGLALFVIVIYPQGHWWPAIGWSKCSEPFCLDAHIRAANYPSSIPCLLCVEQQMAGWVTDCSTIKLTSKTQKNQEMRAFRIERRKLRKWRKRRSGGRGWSYSLLSERMVEAVDDDGEGEVKGGGLPARMKVWVRFWNLKI